MDNFGIPTTVNVFQSVVALCEGNLLRLGMEAKSGVGVEAKLVK
jgi:hypothetical protein